MKYFSVNTLGDDRDGKLVLLNRFPSGLGLKSHRLMFGEKVGEYYPSDAQVQLSEEYPGIKLASLMGNFKSCLIVCGEMKDLILDFCKPDAVEVLPFTLYNHKRRVHSSDYWYVNPIGSFDCVNREASDIKYLATDPSQIVLVRKLVFSSEVLKAAPHLFRVNEDPGKYFISEELANAFKQKNFTNIILKEIEQYPIPSQVLP